MGYPKSAPSSGDPPPEGLGVLHAPELEESPVDLTGQGPLELGLEVHPFDRRCLGRGPSSTTHRPTRRGGDENRRNEPQNDAARTGSAPARDGAGGGPDLQFLHAGQRRGFLFKASGGRCPGSG